EMHEDVQVPNYRIGRRGVLLEPGVCIAIEPMLALGSADVRTLADGWTVVTTDHSLAAHFEHTIAVTESGPVILTTA
ncbi:MAG TPA: M24 family metallopeptidase, partial [Terriglobales bacterium]|nr:M24 family metallopeptidase [Terriglobales bacterium]